MHPAPLGRLSSLALVQLNMDWREFRSSEKDSEWLNIEGDLPSDCPRLSTPEGREAYRLPFVSSDDIMKAAYLSQAAYWPPFEQFAIPFEPAGWLTHVCHERHRSALSVRVYENKVWANFPAKLFVVFGAKAKDGLVDLDKFPDAMTVVNEGLASHDMKELQKAFNWHVFAGGSVPLTQEQRGWGFPPILSWACYDPAPTLVDCGSIGGPANIGGNGAVPGCAPALNAPDRRYPVSYPISPRCSTMTG